jgi:hypothetical protein
MNKYQGFMVVVVGGLVVAVTMLVFQARALTFKVQSLEAERARPAPVAAGSGSQQVKQVESLPVMPSGTTVRDVPSTFDWKEPRAADPTPPASPSKPNAAIVESAILSPAQEQAVARSVDRILEEKYGHLPKVHKPEDMEKMLERELNLTASQKERIAALFAKKREESSEIFKGQNPFSGKVLGKAMELDQKYENLVKAELDNTQQAKYDQLKKEGKINNGISIQIEAGGDENE